MITWICRRLAGWGDDVCRGPRATFGTGRLTVAASELLQKKCGIYLTYEVPRFLAFRRRGNHATLRDWSVGRETTLGTRPDAGTARETQRALRFTVNPLETGKVKDLGINKLIPLLSVLGIELTASRQRPDQKGLFKASVSANVSYKGKLTEARLARALATGKIPPGYESQVSVILDEVRVPFVVKAVEEAARSSGVAPKKIWKNLAWIFTGGSGSDDSSFASFATGRSVAKLAWPRVYAHR